jgi:hypothetical protein
MSSRILQPLAPSPTVVTPVPAPPTQSANKAKSEAENSFRDNQNQYYPSPLSSDALRNCRGEPNCLREYDRFKNVTRFGVTPRMTDADVAYLQSLFRYPAIGVMRSMQIQAKTYIDAYHRQQEEFAERKRQQQIRDEERAKEIAQQLAKQKADQEAADLKRRTYKGTVYATPELAQAAAETEKLTEVQSRTYKGVVYQTVEEAQREKLLDGVESCRNALAEQDKFKASFKDNDMIKLYQLQQAGDSERACNMLLELESAIENVRAAFVQCSKDLDAMHTEQTDSASPGVLAVAGTFHHLGETMSNAETELRCNFSR